MPTIVILEDCRIELELRGPQLFVRASKRGHPVPVIPEGVLLQGNILDEPLPEDFTANAAILAVCSRLGMKFFWEIAQHSKSWWLSQPEMQRPDLNTLENLLRDWGLMFDMPEAQKRNKAHPA